ncbi:MAG: ribonuclease E/G [Chlamydiae bacterium]|nr:ribonuclease E/G [Chlamydiota bacterium]
MTKEILLSLDTKETRCAMLKQGLLYDLVIERKSTQPLTGNIYRGRVMNILRNIQSAFIDINEGENGFIHIDDILENAQKFQEMFDLDIETAPPASSKGRQEQEISAYLQLDQPVLVQVIKEPIGTKGARLTSNISIAGRYLVLLPNSPHRGVSRKIQDKSSRERLKKTIRAFELPQEMGLICRTASTGATTDMLVNEAHELIKIWEQVVKDFNRASSPKCLFKESDLIKRSLLTAVDKKFDRLLVDDYKTYQFCKTLYQRYRLEHPLKIEFYRDKMPMFERFNVEKEIDKALKKKIWLHSGGYLYFEKTEAMHTIDVNSGRSSGAYSDKNNVEETLVRINLEAADEIARQLRLRNVGGLIICDFIDMRSRKNQRRVLDRLKEAMKDDSAKCTILGMSEFGLVEMTRQRNRESLHQTLFTTCPYCNGLGLIKSHESIVIDIERALKKLLQTECRRKLRLISHPHVDNYLAQNDKSHFQALATEFESSLVFASNDSFHLNQFEFHCMTHDQPLET